MQDTLGNLKKLSGILCACIPYSKLLLQLLGIFVLYPLNFRLHFGFKKAILICDWLFWHQFDLLLIFCDLFLRKDRRGRGSYSDRGVGHQVVRQQAYKIFRAVRWDRDRTAEISPRYSRWIIDTWQRSSEHGIQLARVFLTGDSNSRA